MSARFSLGHFSTRRVPAIYALLAAGNLLAWICLMPAFVGYPVLPGTAALAHTFDQRPPLR